MPSERGAALADDFAAANADAIAFGRSCSEEEWRAVVPGEDWSVGVVLHHIAEGHGQTSRWLQAMSSGRGVTETAEDIDRANAAHAVRAGVGRPGRDRLVARSARSPSWRRCCADSTTSSWTGRRRSARPGDRSSPAPISPRWPRATPASTWPTLVACSSVRTERDPLTPVRLGRLPDRWRGGSSPGGAASIGVQRGTHLVGRVGLRRPRCVDAQLVHGAPERCRRRVAGRNGEPDVLADAQPGPAVLHGQWERAFDGGRRRPRRRRPGAPCARPPRPRPGRRTRRARGVPDRECRRPASSMTS